MDAKEIEELHEAIERGDVQKVKRLVEGDISGQFLSHHDISALGKAIQCREDEIKSYLISRGAKVFDYEFDDFSMVDMDQINSFLSEYNKHSEKSCIYYLLYISQSPQGLEGERLEAVKLIYEEFFRSEFLKLLMDVLKSERFDIVFDFQSDTINRVHRLYPEELIVYGLTLTKSREIFIGSKYLLSCDCEKKAKVYGVVAEEFCHLALAALFENIDCNPYREEDVMLREEFQEIVKTVKSLSERSCHVESVIMDVFENYESYEWDSELIARIPHVIGIYGEEEGKRIFKESSELCDLLNFYEKYILTKCKDYTEPLPNKKLYREMKQLMDSDEMISFEEKKIQPLEKGFRSFKDCIVEERGISFMVTNCTKLCTLHVYHELKEEYKEQLDKKCLFFTMNVLEKYLDKIIGALRGTLIYEYVIIMVGDRELFPESVKWYLYDFDEFKEKGLKIISIVGSQSLYPKFQNKAMNYDWSHLNEDYKEFRTKDIRYFFKGVMSSKYVDKENVKRDFSENEILKIMNGQHFEIKYSNELYSVGYNSETYVERIFQTWGMDGKKFQNLPDYARILITGIWKKDLDKVSVNKMLVQFVEKVDDPIQKDKSIFIVKNQNLLTFEDFIKKNPRKTNIWLQYDGNEFILRSTLSDDLKEYLKPINLMECELLDVLNETGVVLISDNAGYGKSTAISNIIRKMMEKDIQSQPVGVDLGKLSSKKISWTNNEVELNKEDLYSELFLLLGIKDGVSKYHFKTYSGKYSIFFDGFDEMYEKYQPKVLKLISFLREKTFAKIIITTRKHLQEELKDKLNSHSYELVPFNEKEQLGYLDMFWKWKLKHPREEGTSDEIRESILKKIKNLIKDLKAEGTKLEQEYKDVMHELEKIDLEKSLFDLRSEIDKIDLTKLAERIIHKNVSDEEILGFIGIPLHLFMIGTVHFGSNFNQNIKSDIYSLYCDFFEQKISIYLEEKLRLENEAHKEDTRIEKKEIAYRIHKKIADQVLDQGIICLDSELDEQDKKICSALGIAFLFSGEVHFIHRTFAEFFKAESVRQNLKQEVFIKILFEEKYKVVRRFLLTSFEKKNFENLSKELFEDKKFLVNIMDGICEIIYSGDLAVFSPNSNEICINKIVKRLLENFELIAGGESLIEKFLKKVERRIKKGLLQVGGFLSTKMLKMLLRRNLEANSIIILGLLQFSDNIEEVRDVLEECILIVKEVDFKRCLFKIRNWRNESRDAVAETFLKLLRLENINGFCLFVYAAMNRKKEVFGCLLKYFRDHLGEEQILQLQKSKKFIFEILICSKGSDKNAIHLLIEYSSSELLIQVLELIKDVLDDGELFKQLLMSKNRWSWNIFHVALIWNKNIKLLLRYCADHLKKEVIKDLIISSDEIGNNVIHLVVEYCSSELLIQNLELIQDVLSNGELFKQLLVSKNGMSWNIFHLAFKRKKDINLLFLFCSDHLEKEEIKDLLIGLDDEGKNILYYLNSTDFSETSKNSLEFIKNYFGENEQLLINSVSPPS